MAKQAAAPIERMAGSKPHKGQQIALEIVTLILFILFMMPFVIVVLNSMRTNTEIINQPVGLPADPGQFFVNLRDIWTNPTFNFLAALRDSVIITDGVSEKAHSPILVTLSGMVTEVRLVHL